MLQEAGQGQTSTLTIFDTTLNDEGSYFCITPTNTAILEKEHHLIVNVFLAPEKASGSPSVINTVAGENTQIVCTFSITNYHGNVIFWRFGETPIRDVSVDDEVKYNMLQEAGQGQTSTLTIFDTTLNDEGSYFCITPTNTAILEKEHHLIVNVPAVGVNLRESPSNDGIGNNGVVRIQMNTIKEFVCSVSKPTKPDASVAWKAAEGVIISESETDFDRFGNLRCVHTVVLDACSRYIVESVPIDITCRLYNDTISAMVMVKRLTIYRENSTKGTFLPVSTAPSTDGMGLNVEVFKLQTGNESDYRVAAKCCTENINACGNVECSDVCESRLQYAPGINEHSQTVLADEGSEAILTCTVNALPPPSSIQWLDQDENTAIGIPVVAELWRTEYGSLTRSTLWVSDAVKAHMYGNYTCSAVNSIGETSHTVSLTGNKFPLSPSRLSVTSSTETTLSLQWEWTTDSVPDLTFTVSHCHDEALLQCTSFGGITDRHFLISGLRSFTVYWISVKTVNLVGESVDAAKMQASTCPSPPEKYGVYAFYNIGMHTLSVKSTTTSPPEKYGVYAFYNTGMHTLSVKSTTSFKDLCFHLEIRVAGVKHRNDTCLIPGEELVIGNDVQQGQLWLVACGRGTCSEPSLVQFVADGLSLDWVIISSSSLGSTGCALIILVTLVCCLRLKRRKRLAAKAETSMRSRMLPAVPFHGQEPKSTYVEPIHHESTEYESVDHMAPADLDVKGKPFQENDAQQTAPAILSDQPYIPMYPVDNASTVIYETSLPLKLHQQQDEYTFKHAANSLRDDSYNIDYRLSARDAGEDHYVLPSKVGK
eukprot:XP_011665336.1 PREDICTED: uncharacterized protein LOC105438787 [Strongylocentrotus purpuratus]